VVNVSRQINSVIIGDNIFCQEGLGGAGGALYAAGKAGYWWCVAKILKCEVISAGCLASAPACMVACKTACVGSLGMGCVACVTACTGGAVALCDSAVDCWSDARNWSCIP
jgi:hypothetical protein